MWNRFRDWAAQWLGARPVEDAPSPAAFAARYAAVREDPITATIAGKLAALTFADSSCTVTGSPRAALIGRAVESLWKDDAERITAQALGRGGMVLLPLPNGRGGFRISAACQSRMTVLRAVGGEIAHMALLVDERRAGNRRCWLAVSAERMEGGQRVRFAAFDESGARIPLSTVPEWANRCRDFTVKNVDTPLFAWLRCPRDSRQDPPLWGVPITYGAEPLIEEMLEHARIYRREYRLTRPMLGLDATLWRDAGRPGERMDIRGLRRTVQDSDDPFIPLDVPSIDGRGVWQYYAPPIRHEAMEARWQSLSRRVERACGLSQGILTERQAVSYANRDEVRAAMYDTFTVVKSIRRNWESAVQTLCAAMDVLAERFHMTEYAARGKIDLSFDWDMSLVERTQETFQQLCTLEERGGMDIAELRAWVTGQPAPVSRKKAERR